MHCNNFFYGTPYINYKHYWKTANFVDTLLYFAYPCFYLCIGATLLDFNNKYGIKEYYKRRIKKIIIPFFSWNIILYFYKVYIIKNFKKKSLSFKYIWTLIFEFKLNFIFKSFFSFIKIYLIIPIFAYVEKSYKVTIYSYFILVLFICQILIPYIIKVLGNTLSWPFNIEIKYVIYVLSGYIIQNHKLHKFIKLLIYIIGFGGFLIMDIKTEKLTIKRGYLNLLNKYYLSPLCYFYTCSVFLFIKEVDSIIKNNKFKYFINKLSELTMGPFLLHLPLLETFKNFFKINKFGVKFRLFGSLALIIFSFFITFIIKKIPLLKYLIP
jgi:hypothetical protein